MERLTSEGLLHSITQSFPQDGGGPAGHPRYDDSFTSMALRLFNTLTQRVEDFVPADGHTVRMYTCGPTVYNYAHIGNLRTFTFQDLLRRWLR